MKAVAVITGGAGFLGSHLCDRLLREGCEVICVDNFCTGSSANIAHLRRNPKFTLVVADANKPLPVSRAIDYVLHFASPASPKDYLRLPLETLEAGSLGTRFALELARRNNARFLLASTSEVYGDPSVHPQPETYWGNVNPVGVRSVYDEAKRFSEAVTTAYQRVYGVDTRIVRLFNSYGPRMRWNDGRMVPTFISQAMKGKPIAVTGDGKQTRTLCFVQDTIEGIYRALMCDYIGPINIGGREEMEVVQVAKLIQQLMNINNPITHTPPMEDDPKFRCPDIALAWRELGWAPQISACEGLELTIEWFQRQFLRPVKFGNMPHPTAGHESH